MRTVYPKVGVVLLNYQGWEDTIECLESLFNINYPDFQIVVVDNNSPNGSLDYIERWAQGQINHFVSPDNPMRNLSFPPSPKPVAYARLQGSDLSGKELTNRQFLTLIQAGNNNGFSSGNNLGIKYFLADEEIAYIWLLNNDTAVHPEALIKMVDCMQVEVGMCGSTLVYYHYPDKLQACGGAQFNKLFFTSKALQNGKPLQILENLDVAKTTKQMDYVIGASMLLSVQFLKESGLLEEKYFLFYEEMDLALRMKGKFYLAYAKDSLVFHKEGGSIGTTSQITHKSPFLDRVSFDSKIKFVNKNYPVRKPLIFLIAGVYFMHRLMHGKYANARTIASSLFNGLKL